MCEIVRRIKQLDIWVDLFGGAIVDRNSGDDRSLNAMSIGTVAKTSPVRPFVLLLRDMMFRKHVHSSPPAN